MNTTDDSPSDPSANNFSRQTSGLLSSMDNTPLCIHRRHSDPVMADLLGNLPLHHAFAHNPELAKIRSLLGEYPAAAKRANQFGRIPLHYAVDRSKVNYDAIKLLVDAYPEGANFKANDGCTPYDVAVKWGHSRELLFLLLDADRTQDPNALLMLKLGFLGTIYFWIISRTRYVSIGVHSSSNNEMMENDHSLSNTTSNNSNNNNNSTSNSGRIRLEHVREEEEEEEEEQKDEPLICDVNNMQSSDEFTQ